MDVSLTMCRGRHASKLGILLFQISASNKLRDTNVHSRPKVVKIGSVLAFDSIVGKAAKIAVQTAVKDVNSDPSVLNGTKLELIIHDSGSSGFVSIIEALHFMASETVALIGPESSDLTLMISYIVKELQVPLLSFRATDPTLSSLQCPFFIRTTHSDFFQMAAIADIVGYYGWRRVIAIYIDDDHGRNGITSLADQFASKRGKISHKAPIKPNATRKDIQDVLLQVSFMESKVLVLHTSTNWGLDILDVAKDLGMMESGYVWITTDWLSTIMDISSPYPRKSFASMQGVITLRSYIKDSEHKRKFITKWKNLTTYGVSTYSLYAYDTIWLLARALDDFFDQGGKLSFSKGPNQTKDSQGGLLNIDSLSVFNGGKILLEDILKVKMNGLTGPMEFTSDRMLVFPAFEVINVMRNGFRNVGYWSNSSRLSISPPKPPKTNQSNSTQLLNNVIWPGETVDKPRGWMLPQNGKQTKIGVPVRISFQDIVKEVQGTNRYMGYSIDVFVAAINLLPYAVPYQFYPYGDGRQNPSYTDLVNLVNAGVYDAAVGDIAIITNRTSMVDFTQPYIESGLVVVTPVKKLSSGTWAIFKPFTVELWGVILISFLVVGAVVWILEHRRNNDFRGTPKQQFGTTQWFIFSTLFFTHKQNMKSTLGRFGSHSMVICDRIGYGARSFVRDYLVKEIGISEARLVPLELPEDYEKALIDGPNNDGVIAIVDERPYIELFLSTRCQFSIVGPEFTKNGWGFAFQQDSHLATDVSNAILKLSETGELQRIHNKWLLRSACSSQGAELSVDRLELKSFKGLFLIIGLACVLSLLVYLVPTIYQYTKRKPDTSVSSGPRHMQTFISSIDEKEDLVIAHSNKRLRGASSLGSNRDDASVNAY
ncbi:unnamed protein product [Lactuca virosa]|uniref:Glutamate receptor n=1 Tax=Lactuca virosa TaxID=75947 RepID=A0AAU9N631_9ASTR|nr:unnamed protein product [Lactuca virosa]